MVPHVTVDYLPAAISSHSVMFTIRLYIDQTMPNITEAPYEASLSLTSQWIICQCPLVHIPQEESTNITCSSCLT